MTVALVAAVALIGVNVLYIRHLEAKDRRHDGQVNRLLVHIHAPEVTVQQAQMADVPSIPAVNPFDEDEYWAAQRDAMQRMAELERDLG